MAGCPPDIYDPAFVKAVFDRCSRRYTAFSYFCSFGFTEIWRRQCVAALPAESDPTCCYDLMAGTGEAWPHLLRRFPNTGQIVAVDISSGMHARAIERLHSHRAQRIQFMEDNVLDGLIPPAVADAIVSTFGLKTFNRFQQERFAEQIARILRPGGSFSMIEASDPRGWWLRPLYLFHLRIVLPLVERLLLRGTRDFAMIGTYSMNFGDSSFFAEMLRHHGLEVEYRTYFFGCATGVTGRKPPAAARA
jgi:ubiquinone/menaquinone biosynthesis C-methylase UbiE